MTAGDNLTGKIAAYAANALDDPLPDHVAERARLHLIDTIAAMISGSRLPAGRAAIRYMAEASGQAACLPGTNLVLTTLDAALAGGMTAHADETDDTHAVSLTHPGSATVPAALAVAETINASGTALLRSVALGYDLCCRMAEALGAYDFFEEGFDTHAFGGVFGAMGAAGGLLGLDEQRFRYALSYAAQQCAGLTTWRRDGDHIEKAFDFAGMPARNGAQSALMVASGMTGVSDVLDGTPSFFTAFGVGRPELAAHELGTRFEIVHTSIKKWCVATPAQASLDGLLELMRDHQLTARDMAAIHTEINPSGARVANGAMPSVNVRHLLAVLALDGTLTFHSSHDADRMADPAVLAMCGRITVEPSTALGTKREAIVEVRTHAGQVLRHHTRHVRGTPDNPMTRAEVLEKATDLIAPILGEKTQALLDALIDIEAIDGVRSLRPLLMSD